MRVALANFAYVTPYCWRFDVNNTLSRGYANGLVGSPGEW